MEKTCLWCRIFGHRWFAVLRVGVGKLYHDKIAEFEFCTRCGEPNPQSVTYGCVPLDEIDLGAKGNV